VRQKEPKCQQKSLPLQTARLSQNLLHTATNIVIKSKKDKEKP
jgi:hypothetical protein